MVVEEGGSCGIALLFLAGALLLRWSGLQGGGAVSLSAHYRVVYWGCSCDLVEVVSWASFPPLPLPFPFLFIFPSPSLLLSSSVGGWG